MDAASTIGDECIGPVRSILFMPHIYKLVWVH